MMFRSNENDSKFILEGDMGENGEVWLHFVNRHEEPHDTAASVKFESKEQLVQFCVSILGYNAK